MLVSMADVRIQMKARVESVITSILTLADTMMSANLPLYTLTRAINFSQIHFIQKLTRARIEYTQVHMMPAPNPLLKEREALEKPSSPAKLIIKPRPPRPKVPSEAPRGAGCSKEGAKYELQVYDVVSHCTLNGRAFNTQQPEDLGGSRATHDIRCTRETDGDIPIEIKKLGSPDWMQCSLQYDADAKRWRGSERGKIAPGARDIFNEYLTNTELFGGALPPFVTRDMTHAEWVAAKRAAPAFRDAFISCDPDTIGRLYAAAGCLYIQVSDRGLFCTTDVDPCGFGAPRLECAQRMRVRTKVHSRADARGFCQLSVMIACQPVAPKKMARSPVSLDEPARLPPALVCRMH
jgi:hypothetical protein